MGSGFLEGIDWEIKLERQVVLGLCRILDVPLRDFDCIL